MALDCGKSSRPTMVDHRLDRLLAPWVFVLTGILFNILSAVITHYFIGLNNDRINLIESEIQNKQVLIDSLWQSKTEIERKKEFFILLLSEKSELSPLIESHYRDYLDEVIDTHGLQEFEKPRQQPVDTDLGLLLELSSAAQKKTIESINNSYLEALALAEQKMPLEGDNARLFSIAIFLQVTGLILVLARDLRRH
jgi:hypothetical protein